MGMIFVFGSNEAKRHPVIVEVSGGVVTYAWNAGEDWVVLDWDNLLDDGAPDGAPDSARAGRAPGVDNHVRALFWKLHATCWKS